jgi:hypothetical protein
LRIELSKREKAIFILIIAFTFGALLGFLSSSHGYDASHLSVYQEDFVIQKDVSVSAQSLEVGTGYRTSFSPPELVFERIEFTVDISNVSGGLLEVNFTKDGKSMRTEYVVGSEKIILGYDGYRLVYSKPDVILRAIGDDVKISHL